MKKLTYLLSLAVVLYCVYGFAIKKEKIAPAPTQKELILQDLLKLQYDLKGNPDYIQPFSAISPTVLKDGRMNLNQKLGYAATDAQHFGVICINDVISLLLENDANVINNSIVYYPILDKTTNQNGIVCVGAQLIQYPDRSSEVKVSSNAKHYTTSWCPSVCQKNADANLAN